MKLSNQNLKTKLQTIFTAALLSVFFVSCASNKEMEVVSADDYSTTADTVVTESSDEAETELSETNESEKKQITKSAKKKKPFSFANMFKSKFYDYDEVSLFTTGVVGGIKQHGAVLTLYPKYDTAGFGSSYMAAYYFVTFEDDARAKLGKAVDRYLKDFDEKKLDRKGKKTDRAYGKIKVRLDFGTIKGNIPNYANAIAYFGYKFKDNSPYFTISIGKTTNNAFLDGKSQVEETLPLNYYMTKAQAKQIAEGLSDENISKAYEKYNEETFGITSGSDNYETTDDESYNEDQDDEIEQVEQIEQQEETE